MDQSEKEGVVTEQPSIPVGAKKKRLRLCGRDKVFIPLRLSFKLQEAVVATLLAIRKLSADRWACLIDAAASLVLVQKLAR